MYTIVVRIVFPTRSVIVGTRAKLFPLKRACRNAEVVADGSSEPRTPIMANESSRVVEHNARAGGSAARLRNGIPLPFARQDAARETRSGLSQQRSTHFCERLLLARASWVSIRTTAKVASFFLEREDIAERRARQIQCAKAASAGLARANDLAMRVAKHRQTEKKD